MHSFTRVTKPSLLMAMVADTNYASNCNNYGYPKYGTYIYGQPDGANMSIILRSMSGWQATLAMELSIR